MIAILLDKCSFDISYLLNQKVISFQNDISNADERLGLEFEDGSILWIGYSSEEGMTKLFNVPLQQLQKNHHIPESDYIKES